MLHEIKATVIIKSPDEYENSRGKISANNARLGDFLPDLQTVMDTARYFRDAGFKVTPSQNCVDIKGSVVQFETMFGVNLLEHPEKACIGQMRIPRFLKNILVKLVFPGVWINSY